MIIVEHQRIRPAAMLYPMDLSILCKGGKGKKGKGDKKGKGMGKGKKAEINKDEKDKDKDKNGKGKGKNNAKAIEYFAGYCLHCKGWGHMKRDCWWNESAKRRKDTASLESPVAPAADTTTEPSITGMLIQSDESEATPVDPTLWLYPTTKREYVHNDFLIDSWGRDICMSAEFGRQPGRNTQRTWGGTQIRYRPSVHDEWQHDT